jgi:hypothetical protein
MIKYQCQNCDYSTESQSDLAEIKHFLQRHTYGDLIANGECPDCGALCYQTVDSTDAPLKLSLHTARPSVNAADINAELLQALENLVNDPALNQDTVMVTRIAEARAVIAKVKAL